MSTEKSSSGLKPIVALTYAAALAAPIIAVAMFVFVTPRQAHATPAYASQTKLACGQCHTTPTGGPTNAFGKAFAANGHQVPKK
jgi:hypothetical protein